VLRISHDTYGALLVLGLVAEEGAGMDPSLFHLDWEQVSEVLATIVVLAFLVERALSLLFESERFLKLDPKGLKEVIAFIVSLVVCVAWKIDALSVILHGEKVRVIGEVLTAGVIAGGSKASLKLFRDVMGIESTHSKAYRAAKNERAAAEARAEKAEK
jgi:hypothetical protein